MPVKDKKLVDDLKLTVKNLNKFWANKLKAIDLYIKTGDLADGTANTISVCHIDGTTDDN
jgi:hypothetical protein